MFKGSGQGQLVLGRQMGLEEADCHLETCNDLVNVDALCRHVGVVGVVNDAVLRFLPKEAADVFFQLRSVTRSPVIANGLDEEAFAIRKCTDKASKNRVRTGSPSFQNTGTSLTSKEGLRGLMAYRGSWTNSFMNWIALAVMKGGIRQGNACKMHLSNILVN